MSILLIYKDYTSKENVFTLLQGTFKIYCVKKQKVVHKSIYNILVFEKERVETHILKHLPTSQ